MFFLMPEPSVLFFGLPLAFVAGFVDAVAGGGGTITLPALLFMGLSPAQAVATNKLLAIFGSASSTVQFWRKGQVEKALVLRLIPLALAGSALGAYLVHFVNPEMFRSLIAAVVLLVGVLVLVNKRFGLEGPLSWSYPPHLGPDAAWRVGAGSI